MGPVVRVLFRIRTRLPPEALAAVAKAGAVVRCEVLVSTEALPAVAEELAKRGLSLELDPVQGARETTAQAGGNPGGNPALRRAPPREPAPAVAPGEGQGRDGGAPEPGPGPAEPARPTGAPSGDAAPSTSVAVAGPPEGDRPPSAPGGQEGAELVDVGGLRVPRNLLEESEGAGAMGARAEELERFLKRRVVRRG